MTGKSFDPRITPARKDIAADFLEGRVEAAHFVAGRAQQVTTPVADIREEPGAAARRSSQLLFGEIFTVYDEAEGWAWGQCAHDDYVGYVQADALADPVGEATHRVTHGCAHRYPEPDLKSMPSLVLPYGARVAVEGQAQDGFVPLAGGGWVFERKLLPIDVRIDDYMTMAATFTGAPYLWGGRSPWGMDCSGLVQFALGEAGIAAPRDTDMQAESIGEDLGDDPQRVDLQSGDLVFFPGHVALVYYGENDDYYDDDDACVLHAIAWDMRVRLQSLTEVIERIARSHDKPVTRIRRPLP